MWFYLYIFLRNLLQFHSLPRKPVSNTCCSFQRLFFSLTDFCVLVFAVMLHCWLFSTGIVTCTRTCWLHASMFSCGSYTWQATRSHTYSYHLRDEEVNQSRIPLFLFLVHFGTDCLPLILLFFCEILHLKENHQVTGHMPTVSLFFYLRMLSRRPRSAFINNFKIDIYYSSLSTSQRTRCSDVASSYTRRWKVWPQCRSENVLPRHPDTANRMAWFLNWSRITTGKL